MAPTSGWLIDAFPLFHFSLGLVFAGVRVDAPPFPHSGLNITLICSNEIKRHLSGPPGVGTTPSLTLVTFICVLAAMLFYSPKTTLNVCVCAQKSPV